MDTVENWLPVVGYEGYEVSDQGRVRSLDRVIVRSNGWPQSIRMRVLSPTVMASGHLTVGLGMQNRNCYVHHLVLEAFVAQRPLGAEACHSNGDPTDNRPANLRWDTRSENVRDQVLHGVHNNARKSHCKRGHLLVAPNLIPSALPRGRRECLSCGRARTRLKTHHGDMQSVSDRYYAEICGTDLKEVS